MEELPRTYSSPWDEIDNHKVAERIKGSKKPKSAVDGDLLPAVVNQLADIIAIPATHIFNGAIRKKEWPSPWLQETQTVIPKNSSPESFDQLRNLSCTNFLSKVFEGFILDRMRAEIRIKGNQYGGMKGSGTAHFLTEAWHNIQSALDDNRSAVSLMSVDFSKAFNRLNHNECVRACARKGASSETI